MELKKINQYRMDLMGLATLLVCLCHRYGAWSYYDLKRPVILKIPAVLVGSVGVDIFLLLSGIGISYSLYKNNDILQFYIRRIKRILPSTMIVCGTYWIYRDLFLSHRGVMKDFFGISFGFGEEYRYWYIHLIILLYFISPVF